MSRAWHDILPCSGPSPRSGALTTKDFRGADAGSGVGNCNPPPRRERPPRPPRGAASPSLSSSTSDDAGVSETKPARTCMSLCCGTRVRRGSYGAPSRVHITTSRLAPGAALAHDRSTLTSKVLRPTLRSTGTESALRCHWTDPGEAHICHAGCIVPQLLSGGFSTLLTLVGGADCQLAAPRGHSRAGPLRQQRRRVARRQAPLDGALQPVQPQPHRRKGLCAAGRFTWQKRTAVTAPSRCLCHLRRLDAQVLGADNAGGARCVEI